MTGGQLFFFYAILKRGSTHGSSETQFSFLSDTLHGSFKRKQKMLVNLWKCSWPCLFPQHIFQTGATGGNSLLTPGGFCLWSRNIATNLN